MYEEQENTEKLNQEEGLGDPVDILGVGFLQLSRMVAVSSIFHQKLTVVQTLARKL